MMQKLGQVRGTSRTSSKLTVMRIMCCCAHRVVHSSAGTGELRKPGDMPY